jgi:integrase
VWWARFQQHGRTVKQSTGTRDKAKARAFLQQQEGKVALKIPVNVQADRLTLKDGAELIRRDYRANQRKSASTLEYRLARLLAAFGPDTRLSRLTTAAVQAYKDRRRAAGAANGTINRETAALARIATLAREEHGLVVPFVVTGLEERNARQGFFEPGDFEAVCRHLPSHLAALARTAYLTGWRKSELRSRQWHHVDFAHGSLRMEPEETKNRRGREFPLVPELRALLEVQRARGEGIQQVTGRVVPWVFAQDSGRPAGDFKRAWATACIKAGFFRIEPRRAQDGTPVRAKDGIPQRKAPEAAAGSSDYAFGQRQRLSCPQALQPGASPMWLRMGLVTQHRSDDVVSAAPAARTAGADSPPGLAPRSARAATSPRVLAPARTPSCSRTRRECGASGRVATRAGARARHACTLRRPPVHKSSRSGSGVVGRRRRARWAGSFVWWLTRSRGGCRRTCRRRWCASTPRPASAPLAVRLPLPARGRPGDPRRRQVGGQEERPRAHGPLQDPATRRGRHLRQEVEGRTPVRVPALG